MLLNSSIVAFKILDMEAIVSDKHAEIPSKMSMVFASMLDTVDLIKMVGKNSVINVEITVFGNGGIGESKIRHTTTDAVIK